MDLSSRKLRYFIAVAEELHFGRAANRLYIAQQSLSAQIRQLEDEIGVELLRRTTRKVELTTAGEAFLAAAKTALTILDQAVEDARQAARGEIGTIKIGFVVAAALELTAPLLAEFRERFPAVKFELREFDFSDTSAGLMDGWADIAIIRPPVSAPRVEYETLFVEPRVIALSARHPLAAHDEVSLSDVLALDQPFAVGITADTAWQDYWTLVEHRAGQARPRLIETHSQTEENEIVAAGAACAITVGSIRRYTPHSGVRYVAIPELRGSPLAIAWHADRRNAVIDSLIAAARAVRDTETELIAKIEHPFEAWPSS
ncbi:LysR substrate-binding domain-containing protein [Amycolatopsis sp. NBC_00345]|uniref:LysR substrate-binding domain-containing protein n=1 Tax=Amycolatopsis sp. NBC_00345 TaxID=2975955 RepID=UPI002E268A71